MVQRLQKILKKRFWNKYEVCSRIRRSVFGYGLDGDRSANIAAGVDLWVLTRARQTGAHHVHQGLAYFSRARSYDLAFFILKHVNPAGPIKGKNDGGTVHRFLVSCDSLVSSVFQAPFNYRKEESGNSTGF